MDNELFSEEDFAGMETRQQEFDKQKRIYQLQKEINFLNSEMKVDPRIAAGVGGAAMGFGLGAGALGVGLGAIIGYNLAKKKEITPELREQIKTAIAQKKSELTRLTAQKEVSEAQISGVLNAGQMQHYTYDELPFTGKWEHFVGRPARNFHAAVWGKPKMGKSYLCIDFAKYLSKFGKVLYVAAEEGFSATLKKKIVDFGLQDANVDFANYRDFNSIYKAARSGEYDFIFIDSVNFVNIEPHEIRQMKQAAPDTGFVTIQQATKQGYARGSMENLHDADIIIEVIDGVAYAQGRFGPPSEMPVFEQPEKKQAAPKFLEGPASNFASMEQGEQQEFSADEWADFL